jgi:hypothetical protein
MIVRDAGDSWQVVFQTDHADLSGAFARAWRDGGSRHASLVVAAERHDDGWAVWEQAPMVDGDGRPINFLDVQIPAHLAFYRACIAAVTEDDAYAGLLISMHGAGIYRQRYGLDLALGLSRAPEFEDDVNAFVDEQEAGFAARADALGVGEEERRRDYALLQVYDRLSLYFCMRDVEGGEDAELQGYRLEPRGPWHVRIDPFPFANEGRFTLLRRLLPKRHWTSAELRQELAAEPQRIEITVER